MEALHRKLLWDRHFPMHLRHFKHSSLKSFMCSAWRGQDSRPGGRWVNSDDLEYINKRSTDKKQTGIEDVEQDALDHLLAKENHNFTHVKSRLFGPRWSSCHSAFWVPRSEQNPDTASADHGATSSGVYGSKAFRGRFQTDENKQYEDQTEYEIDPITNRKVPKKPMQPLFESSTPNDIPVKTFKGYRSQFDDLKPPKTQQNSLRVSPSEVSDTEPYITSPLREDVSLNNTQAENIDHLKKYEESKGFKSTRQYDTSETDIDYSDPVQQGLKRYDDQLSQEANTTKTTKEGTSTGQEDDGLKAYDEKIKSKVRQFFASPIEEIEQNDPVQQAMDRYNSFKDINPPKLIYPDKTDHEDKVLKSRREYEHSDSQRASLRQIRTDRLLKSIRNYEEAMAAERAKGRGILEHSGHERMHPLMKAIQEYEELVKDKKTDPRGVEQEDGVDPLLRAIRDYKSTVQHTEATSPATQEHIQKAALDPLLNAINDYETLSLNSSIRDDLRSSEDTADKADDEYLRAYDAKVNFYRKPCDVENFPQTGAEPDTLNIHIEPKVMTGRSSEIIWPTDVSKFKARGQWNTTHKGSTEPKSWAHLPHKIRNLFAQEAESDKEVLGRTTTPTDQARKDDVDATTGSRGFQEADDKMARRKALEHDFEATKVAEADAKLSAERLRQRKMILESDTDRTQAEYHRSAEAAEASNRSIPSKELSRKMTGNFVRDFPEEFQTAWTTPKESSTGLTPKDMPEQRLEASIQNRERAYINGIGDQAAFSRSPDIKRIEPSLDRTVSSNKSLGNENKTSQENVDLAHQGEGDLSVSGSAYVPSKQDKATGLNVHTVKVRSQKNQNIRKGEDRDLVREVRSIYEDAYGAIDTNHRQIPRTDGVAASKQGGISLGRIVEKQEPTMYKILAYDPTMQSVSSAETTSVIPDSSGPLTPAEVLLRLSNPAKFFPHFEPLRAQGYEIVSGSGDVLVFRKVRDAIPLGSETITAAAKEDKSALEHKKNVMNPIDGMTRGPVAATGDFASPTGFVNYDIPRGSEPPFKSNIDVRREEPVFSGKRNWEYENENSGRKTGGATKTVLIGAGWLAACSYAIGVVSEYFKTGGVDGQGPKGF